MDNKDIYSLKDKSKMDANAVWQWRIMRVNKYSRRPEPFHHSNRIGLDFNVGSSTKKKLDLQFVTNGVILEICDFAKIVNKSKRSFITNILENNFDLGLENEQQRIDFTSRILHKVKDLIRKPPKDKNEVFTLFDTSSKPEFSSNDGLNMASTELTESFLVEMDDTDDSEHEDEFKCSEATSKEYFKTEGLSEEVAGAHGDDSEHEEEFKCSEAQSAEDLKEDVLSPSFPYCEEIGLCLDIGSKQSLDPDLLTKGVMLELVHFTKILTASYSPIVLAVLEHNFELDLKSQQAKYRVWFKISQLLRRRKRLISTGNKISPEFKNEPFSFHTCPFKRTRSSALSNMEAPQYQFKEVTKQRQSDLKCKQQKRALLPTTERVNKKYKRGLSEDMETNTLSHRTDLSISHTVERDHSHTCPQGKSDLDSNTGNQCDMEPKEMEMETNYIRPLGESDLDSDKVMDSGNSGNQDRLQNSKCSPRSDVPKESESLYLGAPFLVITDVRSILPTVKSNVNPPFASQPDERGFCTSEKQTETQGNASNNYDMDQEEMGTENIIWKLRANRVKQILSEFHIGVWSRNNGLEFNVGCGPKQNIRAESFTNPALLEVAHVALALNSSQQNFIMEILEYNFNFCLQSEQQREVLSCEIVKRIRQLKECKDAVKLSKEVFELAGVMPSINVTNQSIDHVKEECDDVPVCPPQSHAETEEHISQKGVDLYPFCKEIGLKLHVNNSQPIKKLDINRLTNGAMTEVANFAEKLCGTFEQICLDILRHNLESVDSDPARNILARIPAVVDRNNLITSRSSDNRSFQKQKRFAKKTMTAQDVSSSINIAHKNALVLKLWQLRASHIKQILSIPHQEHCPLYSYSRCKKLGIDFNVGFGVKQNLDPKLLTNGIMAELTAFTTTLLEAQKYFITEILAYNFNLHFKNELRCSAFAQKTMGKVKAMHSTNKRFNSQMNELFELPDTGCIEELPDMRCHKKTTYCPKCYQDRNNKLHQDESDPGHMHHPHPHIMTDAVSAGANCTAQKQAKDPSSTFSAIEEMIMNSYPLCKNIGLNLCVDKGQPKDKLDLQLLTCKVMNEVAYFAKELSGTKKREILNDVIEHNFNITLLQRDICPGPHFFNMALRDFREDWFNEVFVIPPILQKTPSSNRKQAAAMQSSERKETCKKRKLALQAKEESATLSSHSASVLKKTKTNPIGRVLVDCYPICTEIGLDLDMTSKSREKEKLDLKLLTRAVVFEMHEFTIKKKGCYLPHSLYEILDYNFDLTSQHHRRWEFSLATAFKVQTMVKQYLKKQDRLDEVFELPFVFEERPNWKKANVSPNIANKSSFPDICEPFLTSTDISSSLPAVNSNVNPPFASQPDKRGLNGNEETLTPRNEPNKYEMEQEEIAIENNYICPLGESDLDSDKVTDSEDTGEQDHLHNPIILREPESSHLGVCSPSLTTTDVSAILQTVNSNVNTPFPDGESGHCGGEEPTQTSGHSPNECDLDQEEMRTMSNMWKLRANRVKQILSASEFCSFNCIKCMGFVFNVGSFPKQNINIDLLTRSLLFEVAQFALAMNSSQQNFIMEILEYNFNFYLQSEQQRAVLSCEIMKRIRELKECKDAVKLSKEVFELAGVMPSTDMTNLSMSSVKEECDDVPVCRPHSHAETKDHISQKGVDLYPFCKEIGLKLHVNNSQPIKKLDINRLTNGAMTEVANFAEKLCGTFEQVCLDILRHNFNLDLQSGDCDIARNILAHIPFIVDQKNLANCSGFEGKVKGSLKLDFQNKPTVGACSARFPQTTMTHQDARSSTDIEYQNEDNLKLWQLRANHVQQILSVPHLEDCPFYSYSRCKKLGIDFNVGFGVKQNLDPKLLTNGLMVELNTFVTALISAQKYFITDILECNFDLDLKDELHRSAFAQQTTCKVKAKYSKSHINDPVELPDMRYIKKSTTYCPKCYQDRNHRLRQDESDPGHMHRPRPHTLTDAVPADVICATQKSAKDPSSTFSAIVDNYPRCKKIGLKLCVDKYHPKDKLGMHLLTRGVMNEVSSFTHKMCGSKMKILKDVLEHNFNVGLKGQQIHITAMFRSWSKQNGKKQMDWFNEVFPILRYTFKGPVHVSREERAKLALEAKEEGSTLSSHRISIGKSDSIPQSKENCFPIFKGIGLDQDMASVSGNSEELDLKLLTRAVCTMEQEEIRAEDYYTCPLGESDLDSDEITDSEDTGNQDHLQNPKCCSLSSDIPRESESSFGSVCASSLTTTDVSSSLQAVNPNMNPAFANQTDESELGGGEGPTSVSNEYHMSQEEMGIGNIMWKLRANRVKQILSAFHFGSLRLSKKYGLEFNVGLGPKRNMSPDNITNALLLEVAKFALAINSSQQNFIMEILEYNFNFYLQSEQQREVLICEIMNRVRQLKESEDAVKLSKEVFQLAGPMSLINMGIDHVKEECDDVPVCRPHSHADTKDHISQERVDLYPFCKEIGLQLHVNNSRPNKKLDINRLTNGAMTEVANFAEELCGTFDQICLDIFGHNFDLDLQSGDSVIARNMLAQIPAIVDQKNLSNCTGFEGHFLGSRIVKLDFQSKPPVGACSAPFSQATMIHQDARSSSDIEYQNEDNLKLWQLRANHVQQILSVPHLEDCPFYSYPRCKKLGIDFNVGFGVKQNLDPILLTNGLMAELNTFATALISAQKYFITDILECNFDIDLKDELYRSAFAQLTINNLNMQKKSKPRINNPFELPDMRCIQKSTTYCPKCYQDRNHRLRQDESDPGHMHRPRPHTLTDTVPEDANCAAQKSAKDPSSTFSAIEETLMDNYPRCKKIGLKLCVDKDHSKDKLGIHLLTRGVMNEVASFTRKMCGSKMKIVKDVVEHNFNVGMKGRRIDIAAMFRSWSKPNIEKLMEWFNEVFPLLQYNYKGPVYVSRAERAKLALEAKEEESTPSSHNISVGKSNTIPQSKENCFPIFKGIGLDQDMASVSGNSEELDLKLLTRAVCTMEQEEIRAEDYYTCPLGESDLDSDEVTDSEDTGNQDHLQNPKCCSLSSDIPRESESGFGSVCAPSLTTTDVSCGLQTVNPNVNPLQAKEEGSTPSSYNISVGKSDSIPQSKENCFPIYKGIDLDQDMASVSGNSEELDLKLLTRAVCTMEQVEIRADNYYTCPLGESALDSDEVTDSEDTGNQDNLQSPKCCSLSSDIPRESESGFGSVCAPSLTTTDVSCGLQTVNPNVNPLQAKEEGSTPSSYNISVGKSDSIPQSKENCFPIYKGIDLDQDMASVSGNSEELDLKLLTRAVCTMEQVEIRANNYYTCPLGESALDSDEVTDSEDTGNQDHLQNPKCCSLSSDIPRESESSFTGVNAPSLTTTDVSCGLQTVNPNVNPLQAKEEGSTPSSHNISVGKSHSIPQSKENCFDIFKEMGLDHDMASVSGKSEGLDMKLLTRAVCAMEQEEIRAEDYYTCRLGESDLDSDEVTDSEDTGNQDHLQNPKCCSLSSDIPRESESSFGSVCAPSLTTTDVSSSLQTVNPNVNPPFANQTDESELGGGEGPTSVSNKYHMDQEKMGTGNIMWKLRANRVKQILSAFQFGSLHLSKKYGLEFNVGFGPKRNMSVTSLNDSFLMEVAKFALVLNSSLPNFVMEILEYNFNFYPQSEPQKEVLSCEIVKRIRQLKECKDAVKLSKEVFELAGVMPSINVTNQSIDRVKEECDDVPGCPPQSHAETEEHISQKSVALYPFCKEIGLKLHVNNSQPIKKLDINRLTNGAMTEVANFAEELCGTFDQICLDLLGHNFDLDLQSGNSDIARNILARIPATVDRKNLLNCAGFEGKVKGSLKLDFQNKPTVGACSAHSPQATMIHQDVRSSTDTEYQNEDNLKLWQLRANHVQQILSVPHLEDCPFYSYSRCKKLGIDFNVGFGVKQNLDPNLLTNGIMAELNTFATALISAQKYFITDILECNFDLDLKDELYRSAFAQQTIYKVKALTLQKKYSKPRINNLFELPDMRCIQKSIANCPKCYQDRNHKLRRDKSDPGHMHHPRPHTVTDAVPADANCATKKSANDPSSTLSAIEETLMDNYPRCKKIGLKWCVDKDHSKDKLDMHLLTRGVMNEVASFTNKMCGSKMKIVKDVLEHNFNIGLQGHMINAAVMFRNYPKQKIDKQLDWFNEVFPIQESARKVPVYVSCTERVAALRSERKEAVKRQLALQAKEEGSTPSSTIPQSKENCFPVFKGIGLAQDMVSVSGNTEELDSKLLTRAVCVMEQVEVRADNYYTCPLEDSDLDSDEFKDSEDTGNQNQLQNPEHCFVSSGIPRESESSHLGLCALSLATTDVSSSLPAVKSNVNPPFASQPDERGFCTSEKQTQTHGNSSIKYDMDQEEMETENIMWKLRGNRVKQILSEFQCGPFNWSKNNGLEFNVGFGPKQNISADSFSHSALLEVAKFALAMNSSQENFIMEILEYNFNFYLQSEQQREVLICEIMNRVRQLKESNDAVKLSKEVFQLTGPSSLINMGIDHVKEECDDVPVCRPHSHADTKDHISQERVDLYPFCKEIGLQLHVNNSQPNKKLDINRLTNGAMTEVANFAEELCGTFEQICLDILRHNLDLDLQSEDSVIAKNILARIPAIVDHNNLLSCLGPEGKLKGLTLDFQNNPTVGECSARSSQATMMYQDVRSFTDIKYQNEDNLKLWQLRANCIQQILSVPHLEDCPFYSYSRCKKLGIDFNVGFGVKQNLDPKLLTNGIMVELNTFATALRSVQKYFITDILECNFDLDLKDELHRSAFAQQIIYKVNKQSKYPLNKPFELPDMRCIQKSTTYCPKCYQDRNHKLHQNESDPDHMHHPCPHTVTDAVPADANCATKKSANNPSSTLSAIEETLMDNYPRCKKIGLKLCVDKDQRKDKLDMHLLTRGVMDEVASFTKKLSGTQVKSLNDVIEHNFKICMKGPEISPGALFQRVLRQNNDTGLAWDSEVFAIQQSTPRVPGYVIREEQDAAMHQSKWKEAVNTRQLALQAKEEGDTLSSHNINVEKSKTSPQGKEKCLPIFKGIAFDQDMASISGNKEEPDLKLLTGAVCDMKQEEIETDNYYTRPLGESDQESDEVKDSEDSGNQDQLQNPERCFVSSGIPRESESSHLGLCALSLATTDVSSSLPAVKSNVNPPFASQPDERGFCISETQTQTHGNSSIKYDMDQEEMETENIMWKLRGNRVKQILSEFQCGPFNWSKNNGLEFNVGFGPKQSINADSFSHSALLEVAKFALAMNSSQENFIMEILEYNFNIYPQSEQQREVLICEIMNRVRQLKESKDAVKLSKEVFQLAGPMSLINMGIDHIKEECDDVPVCRPHSHADTKDHISQERVDLYPFCKEIGLQLHVNNSQPNKKLDINRLTNGAMTEVANFADELCGTFDQICLDILKHNLDLDLQSGDSDIARSIVAQIHAVMKEINPNACLKVCKKLEGPRKVSSIKVEQDCHNNPNLDACTSGSSQAATIAQDISKSPKIELQNELESKMWQLQANHIQQILSIPHEEQCPLYSYRRCKKLGIDFNVGSGVKQNLDPKLLTNGIMVELNAFATALLSSQKYFITEILEHNFHLDFDSELHRSSFAQQTMQNVTKKDIKKQSLKNLSFELPDTRSTQEPTFESTYCPKCYQSRNLKLRQYESDSGHLHHAHQHTMTSAVCVDMNCTAQKQTKDASSTFSTIEKRIMDSYPLCKKAGLNLFVDKDPPKVKLEDHVLTRGMMNEVVRFARRLCIKKSKIIHSLLEHNFNIGMQGQDIDLALCFRRAAPLKDLKDGGLAWFDDVFEFEFFQPVSHRKSEQDRKVKQTADMHESERKETIKKRQLALRAKMETSTLGVKKSLGKKSKTKARCKVSVNCYPNCTEIGLDLDVTPQSREKEKLDLKLLTRAVVFEIHKFATKQKGCYMPHTVFNILDYNFDLSSQHHRRWEFSIATTYTIITMVKNYRHHHLHPNKVFKLPFVFDQKDSQSFPKERRNKRTKNTSKGHFVRQVRYHLGMNRIHFLDGVTNKKDVGCRDEDKRFSKDLGTNLNLLHVDCGSPVQGNIRIKEEYDPCSSNMTVELGTDEKEHPQYDIKTESTTTGC